jgi:hypothetical protein
MTSLIPYPVHSPSLTVHGAIILGDMVKTWTIRNPSPYTISDGELSFECPIRAIREASAPTKHQPEWQRNGASM